MITNTVSPLRELLIDHEDVPKIFLNSTDTEKSSVYVVSCFDNRLLYVDPSFELITGYSFKDLSSKGLEFWISRVHPDDLEQLNHEASLYDESADQGEPILHEYRYQKKDGQWIWMRMHKHILPPDKILIKITDITDHKRDVNQVARRKECGNRLLEITTRQLNEEKKNIQKQKDEVASVTKREREVLVLIGEGLSSKQISDKLFISIHTVETHRAHLLKKLDAKNSMELIKKSSRAFSL